MLYGEKTMEVELKFLIEDKLAAGKDIEGQTSCGNKRQKGQKRRLSLKLLISIRKIWICAKERWLSESGLRTEAP